MEDLVYLASKGEGETLTGYWDSTGKIWLFSGEKRENLASLLVKEDLDQQEMKDILDSLAFKEDKVPRVLQDYQVNLH